MNFDRIIKEFKNKNYTISTMESCSGGGVSNSLTNCLNSSDIMSFCCVTYSNDFKIKMGVDKDIIDKYSVYSMECANSMSKAISDFTNSTYGIGITGKLNYIDKNNDFGDDNKTYISIYNRNDNSYKNDIIISIYDERYKNKELIINKVIEMLEEEI